MHACDKMEYSKCVDCDNLMTHALREIVYESSFKDKYYHLSGRRRIKEKLSKQLTVGYESIVKPYDP